MKKIDFPILRGTLLCASPDPIRRLLSIGHAPNSDICVRMSENKWPHNGIERHVRPGIGSFVSVTCGNHRALTRIPSNIGITCDINLEKFSDEPILSMLPAVAAALKLWRRAFAKTDIKGDELDIDCANFDGILPVVVAAAMRGVVVVAPATPKPGIFKSTCNLLHVDVMTKQPKDA